MAHQTTEAVVVTEPLFESSFEPVATSIDMDSAMPAPGAVRSSAFAVDIGINFTYGGTLVPGVVSMALDGIDVSAAAYIDNRAVSYFSLQPLPVGAHTIVVHVGDEQASWSFQVVAAPEISDFSPHNETLPAGSQPMISARFRDAGSEIDPDSIRLLFNDENEVTGLAEVEIISPNEGIIRYTPPQVLPAGQYFASLYVANRLGALSSDLVAFSVGDLPVYTVAFTAPADGATVLQPELAVLNVAGSNRGEAVTLQVNGAPSPVQSYTSEPRPFATIVFLQPGLNVLTARAGFSDGEVRSTSISVTYDAPPQVTISSPEDGATLGPLPPGGPPGAPSARPVTVTGSVSRPVVAVAINQQPATLSADGLHFSLDGFVLHEGNNLLSASASDELGRSGTANIAVYVDQTAPLLSIESPTREASTSRGRIDVRGRVNDAVAGGNNLPEPSVLVNNDDNGASVSASVLDGSFIGLDLPLEVGLNHLRVTVRDALGNTHSEESMITRIAVGSQRVTEISGNRQSAAIQSRLPAPLVVAAIDANGLPLAGLPLHFDVARGTGSISRWPDQPERPDGIHAARNLVVATDATGQAQVWLTLSSEAQAAGNVVRVWSQVLAEEVEFTATGERGAPKWVMVDGAAGSQFAETNSAPLEALRAIVLDTAANRLPGMPVRFEIEDGDALFSASSALGGSVSPDGRSVTVASDRNGLATVRPRTGNSAGTVRVRASVQIGSDAPISHALFQIITLPRLNGPTGFGGSVLDHTGAPIAGVALSIGGTALATTSAADGRFVFSEQVPPGKIDLFIDGRQVPASQNGEPLQYPALHVETAIIQGQMNQLPHAIYLPPIHLGRAQIVGGDEDVHLSLPGFEGFEMIVKAHSVTFPDGSHIGPLTVNPVHNDRLPMVPPGAAGRFAGIGWTLQPSGTHFDPPISVRIPNSDGLQPGETMPIVQWDHDLAMFLPIGRGTVSEDASQVITDPGSGITKAGWGGNVTPPPPPNCAINPPPATSCRGTACSTCGACKKLSAGGGAQCPSCQIDLGQVGQGCGGNACHRCNGNGACVADPVNFPEISGERVSEIDFLEPKLLPAPIADQARFAGFRGNPTAPATWTFEVEPYCTPAGVWRFHISKARIETSILRSQPPTYDEISGLKVLSHPEPDSEAFCRYYNSVELTLRWNNSAHFPSGPRANLDIANLIAQGWGGPANGHRYNRWQAINAHEQLHFRRFKGYVNAGWQEFVDSVESFELPMDTYGSIESAQQAPETYNMLVNAKRRLEEMAIFEHDMGGPGDHSPAADFYGCATQALSLFGQLLDSQRLAFSCEERFLPPRHCPN